jgi:predicted amidohydrolase YtcJ
MIRRHKVLACFAVLMLILVAVLLTARHVYKQWNPAPPLRQVFYNGQILTMDDHSRIAEAVLIEGDRIAAVGSQEEIVGQVDGDTVVTDLNGKTMLPGFIEAHGHFPGSGLSAVAADVNSPPIGDVESIAEALEKIREQASRTPQGEWVIAYGFDDTMVAEKRFITGEELDRVSTKHPIYVLHISAHMGVANRIALEEAGLDEASPDPEGGEIVRDGSGHLTGLLKETAHEPLRDTALQFSLRRGLDALRAATRDYLSKGITTAQNGLTFSSQLSGLMWASRLGLLPLRLVIWPDVPLARAIQDRRVKVVETDRFTVGAAKIISDGSIQGYTGYLTTPYHTVPDGYPEDYRGYPTLSADELTDIVTELHALGWQIAVHANGDAAIDAVIDAVAQAQREFARDDPRHIIVHAQMTRDDQLEHVRALGMTPSFFPAHVYYWGDRHRDIFIGPQRAARISPLRTAQDKRVRFTIHLDTPVVPMDPLLLVWTAVRRETSSGQVLGKGECIDVMQALRAVTIDAAWQVFQEDTRGSIEPGKFADLVVLSEDPLADPDALPNIVVEKTLIGGVVFFHRDDRV